MMSERRTASSERPSKTNPSPAPAGLPGPFKAFGPGGGPMGMLGETEKSEDTRGTLLRLWGYLQRQRWILMGTGLLVVVASVADLLGPYLMGLAIDQYIDRGDLSGLARLAGLMILTYVVAAGGTWLQSYWMAGVAQFVVRDLI